MTSNVHNAKYNVEHGQILDDNEGCKSIGVGDDADRILLPIRPDNPPSHRFLRLFSRVLLYMQSKCGRCISTNETEVVAEAENILVLTSIEWTEILAHSLENVQLQFRRSIPVVLLGDS